LEHALKNYPEIYLGEEAIDALIHYCQIHKIDNFLLVSDENTYRALGREVERRLIAEGCDVITALLSGEEVVADDHFLLQVFLQFDCQERTFLAVGSGTITDITRFVSHRARSAFIAVPTAPSVDGFTSIGAPLVIEGMKRSVICHPPLAVFADLPTLCKAPPAMIAAGFGDMIGKLLSTADWKLGNLLWDEPFDEQIFERARRAAVLVSGYANDIGRGNEDGIRALMHGLIESGFCMLDFGNSAPASGSEHHISHFWEMKILREKRPAILHGAKVGLACLYSAKWYAAVSDLTKDEVASRLDQYPLPDPMQVKAEIRAAFPGIAEHLISEQADLAFITPQPSNALKKRILAHWHEVVEIARSVPPPAELKRWLHHAGAPLSGNELGLGEDEISLGLEYGHFLRNRFTIGKLRKYLNIP
jgi:glycerol-1-phosphate dehydrogenase [NAD(P)+]